MLEKRIEEEKIQFWQVIDLIVQREGEQVLGNLSEFGMEEMLMQYIRGRFSKEAHEFYGRYLLDFAGTKEGVSLYESRQRFNKEIRDKVIRY